MNPRWTTPAALAAIASTALALTDEQPRRAAIGHAERAPVHIVDLGLQKATIAATGELVQLPAQQVWRPMCGTAPGALTPHDLRRIADAHDVIVASEQNPIVVDRGTRMAGINIVYNISGSVPSGATGSFALAEAFLESVFSDPITVTVSVSFSNLGGGVLGSTGPNSLFVAYSDARTGLINGMDSDDVVQSFLPSGTTVPVRYDASTTTVTNESQVQFTRAAYNSTVGTVSGSAASMSYNNAFSWDFDPSNGIGAGLFSLTDVVIHETGHAMGFVSGVDFLTNDLAVLDLARFQRTDGTGDFNPDTNAEFTTTARTVDFNNLNDDANTDIISVEYRMSDGSPNQASHFREQTTNIGIMDPAFSSGQTFIARDYFTQADIDAFDFIGYNYPPCAAPTILSQPGNQDVCEGETIALSVAVLESSTFQWFKDGVVLTDGGDISGATDDLLLIANASTADEGDYTCVVSTTSEGCDLTSATATVTVDALPFFLSPPPASQTVTEGDPVSITASFVPIYNAQWLKNGSPVSNGGGISGATTGTLTFASAQTSDSGNYTLELTDTTTGCSSTSSVSVLTVEEASEPCPADLDGSGTLTLDDVALFVTNLPDLNGDTFFNLDDVTVFTTSFTQGCP